MIAHAHNARIKEKLQKQKEQLNDAQILFDEADDVALIRARYAKDLGLYLLSPSSAVQEPERIKIAATYLKTLGFKVKVDPHASDKFTRFAGTDEDRAKSFSRAAKDKSKIVMATRGGYGLNRILPMIDWKLLEANPKTYVGYSDFIAFNLALLAKTGMMSYTGPNAVSDFGGDKIDELTRDIFVEVMRGELEVLSFISEDADPVDTRGVLWGGNLAMVSSLIGTPYMPKIKNGIFFFEDVGEHPYRVERMLTQLLHAGILQKQKAIILGHVTDFKLSASDNGYDLSHTIAWLRSQVKVPVVTGLPYGHGDIRVTLPIGKKVGMATEDGMAHLVLDEHQHQHEHDS